MAMATSRTTELNFFLRQASRASGNDFTKKTLDAVPTARCWKKSILTLCQGNTQSMSNIHVKNHRLISR